MPQYKGFGAFGGRPTPQQTGSRAFWGQPYFQYGVARHALATVTSAVVSVVLPLPAAPQSDAPNAPLVRWIRPTATAAAPASSRASAAEPRLPRSRAALSDAVDSTAPKAAASRSGSAPATPHQCPRAAPPPALPKLSLPYLVFLSGIAFQAAPCRRIVGGFFIFSVHSVFSASSVQMLFHFFNASIF